MFGTVTTIVSDENEDGIALSAALDFARQVNAHLEVICIAIDTAPVEVFGAVAGGLPAYSLQETHEAAEDLKHWASAMTRGYSRVSVSPLIAAYSGLKHMVGRLTRFSDIVVAARPMDGSSPSEIVFDALTTAGQQPVLLISKSPLDLSKLKRATIAWDESDQALNAVKASIPLLQKCEQVEVVMIDPKQHSSSRTDPGSTLSSMLARHDVAAEVHLIPQTLPTVAEQILRFSDESGSQMVVMGCYGHSPLKERLLGGVTRDMIANCDLPMLLNH